MPLLWGEPGGRGKWIRRYTKRMNKEDYAKIFLESHPGFFEGKELKDFPEGRVCEEMFLPLEQYDETALSIPIPEGVTIGYYDGDREVLLAAADEVVPGWSGFFKKGDPVFCAMVHGELASFCLLEDMGQYTIDGKRIKVGGPGCVGTLPKFRRQGIGLAMIQKATGILKNQGYDYSYIHYTGVAPWYAKLGYVTQLKWDKNGIL